MTEPSDPGGDPPPDDLFAALDLREELFTGALANAARAEHLASAIRLQVMLAGFDAMLLEEEEQTGRRVRPDDPVVRAFLCHQAETLHVTRWSVEQRIEHGRVLRDRLPRTWRVLLEGGTSEQVAGVAAAQSVGLPDAALPEFDRAAAELVARERASVVERELARLRDRLAPEAGIERHERQATRRYVAARPEGDGGGVLEIHSTAVDVAAMYDALRQRGVAAHGADGECRTLGQLMADDATDLVLAGAAAAAGSAPTPEERAAGGPAYPMERLGDGARPGRKAVQATILVVVPAETATGAANAPAEVAGMGSIDAETARRVVAHSRGWTRAEVDPVDDAVLGIDTHDRHIPSGLKKLLHLRTPTCAGDGCGLPAHRADVDHIVRYEHDGRTRHDNLQILCRRSHQAKDQGHLAVRMLDDGTVVWRDRWGGRRVVRPAVHVRTRIDRPEEAPF